MKITTTTMSQTARAAEGGGAEEQLAPGPKQVGVSNLRNILKLNEYKALTTALKGINDGIKRH